MVQITLDTRDIFIEVTATDLAKAHIVAATVATMFSQYCSVPYEIEPVEVVDAFGDSRGLNFYCTFFLNGPKSILGAYHGNEILWQYSCNWGRHANRRQ